MITLLGTILLIYILWKVLKFTFKISLGLFILIIPISIIYFGYEYYIAHRIFIIRTLVIVGVVYFIFGNNIKKYLNDKGVMDKIKNQFEDVKNKVDEEDKKENE